MTGVDSAKVRAVVLGLATGDALAWISAEHRLQRLPERRVKHFRWLQGYSDDTRSTTRPVPNVHSSPVGVLRPAPADDTEWFVFSATAQLRAASGEADAVRAAWSELAARADELRARSGTYRALRNLQHGQLPPMSGHDNPHYFDDIASIRAVAAGILASDDAEAADLAQRDAEVTHSLDGLWCARATSVLISRLLRGASTDDAIAASLRELPDGRWSRRIVEQALEVSASSSSALDLALQLDRDLVDKIYSYPVAGPETLGLVLAHLQRSSSAEELMLGALGQARNADAVPALAGAVAGARFGGDWLPQPFIEGPIYLDGVSIPWLEGQALEPTIAALQAAVAAEPR
jgi:ADP-ribosylglycohydrolase